MQVKDHLSLSYFIVHLFNFLHEHNPPNKYNSDQDYRAIGESLLNKNLDRISINYYKSDRENAIITLSGDTPDSNIFDYICICGGHDGKDISINVVPGHKILIGLKLSSRKQLPFIKDFIGTEYILCPTDSENFEFMSYDEMNDLLLQFTCR